jgi:hypothetical protein
MLVRLIPNAVLDVVAQRILEGGVNNVIVVSETGRSAVKAVEKIKGLKVKDHRGDSLSSLHLHEEGEDTHRLDET